jgi:hypothetical protein
MSSVSLLAARWKVSVAMVAFAMQAVTAYSQSLVTEPEHLLADWKAWPLANVRLNDAEAAMGDDGWLLVDAKPGKGRSGIVVGLDADQGNLESWLEVAVPVRNLSKEPIRVVLRVDDDRTQEIPSVEFQKGLHCLELAAGPETVWLKVLLGASGASVPAETLFGMQVKPADLVRGGIVDANKIRKISIFVPEPNDTRKIAVGGLVARGDAARLAGKKAEEIFPFIDEFGQYIHRDWPGKLHAEKEFAERRDAETAELAAHARPADWDRFGGWVAGPQQKATGFFRVEKINGWWWMVDPEGRLFWSHGVVRVGTRIRVGTVYHGTPIADREFYFRLPPKDSPLGAFFGTEPRATGGYYADKEGHAVFDHLEANLFRKYGPQWAAEYATRSQERLASWALNTIANSSDPAVFAMQKTPYTAVVYSVLAGRNEHCIQGSSGIWVKLPDPFDPGWHDGMRRTLHTDLKNTLNDPWCLGYFVDNELNWGDACYLAEATLASPAEQAAKKTFVEQLKRQYAEIGKLNAAWKSEYASWDALLASTAKPDRKVQAVTDDLSEFTQEIVEAYFRGCREAIREVAPNQLYLGCRFAHSGNAKVMEAAAKYCDIISINRYSAAVDDLRLPAGLDRPIVIGEFSFGAMDRGMFFPGWQERENQVERAKGYCGYVESALRNPAIVGTHWFQYFDQPTTGRFDGENSQFGLLDICDTPYQEMVDACRKMGHALYAIRTQAMR